MTIANFGYLQYKKLVINPSSMFFNYVYDDHLIIFGAIETK